MHTFIRWALGGLGVMAGLALLIWAVQQNQPSGPADNRLTVATTIFPLADMARNIGGEQVHVVEIIPPGVSEHSSALTPQQLDDLQKTLVIFQIGHRLDERLTERIVKVFPDIRLVTVDNGIELREFNTEMAEQEHHEDNEGGEHEGEEHAEEEEHHHDTGIDPHYWLTASNAIKIAATIAQTLQQLDPANAAVYQKNLVAYQAELVNLEKELQSLARSLPRQEFMAMHNAWSYFASQYGLRIVATYEPVEGQNPAISDLKRLQDAIQQYGITTFYAEPQKASTAVTTLMRQEFGLKVLTLDPVGGRPETDNYINLMHFNMKAIAEGSR